MPQDFLNSVKARLYDFKYTPFLSSYIFAWIYVNRIYLLIFFSSQPSTSQKVQLISHTSIEYLDPLYFALVYVFLFPIATAVFYWITLMYKKLMNWIQQKIQDKTPMPQETANAILRNNRNLQKEVSEIEQEMTNIKRNYEIKEKKLEDSFETRIKERVEKEVKNKTQQINEDKKSIEKQFDKYKNDLTAKIDLTNEQQETIKNLNNKISHLTSEIESISKNYEVEKLMNKQIRESNEKVSKAYKKFKDRFDEEEILVLNAIYEGNVTRQTTLNAYINAMKSKISMQNTKIEVILSKLKDKGYFIMDNYNFDLTVKGKELVVDMFG